MPTIARPLTVTPDGFVSPVRLDASEVVLGLSVTATFLATLQISPVLGRNFLDDEDRPGGNTRVVLLGDGFWRAFGPDPTVVGRTITLNSQPYRNRQRHRRHQPAAVSGAIVWARSRNAGAFINGKDRLRFA